MRRPQARPRIAAARAYHPGGRSCTLAEHEQRHRAGRCSLGYANDLGYECFLAAECLHKACTLVAVTGHVTVLPLKWWMAPQAMLLVDEYRIFGGGHGMVTLIH